MKVCLLRVGIDMGCGRTLGPLFDDLTFEYVPIPEGAGMRGPTYGETHGRNTGRTLLDFFPPARRKAMMNVAVHDDPEFETFTYGDPTGPKRSLRRLGRGDMLVFYAGLASSGPGAGRKRGLYIIGYFEVEAASEYRGFTEAERNILFGNNHHIKYREENDRLVLVKGGPGSRLLRRAQPISRVSRDRGGHRVYVLSAEAKEAFGSFTKLNAIQRSPPRWVSDKKVEEAAGWIRKLP